MCQCIVQPPATGARLAPSGPLHCDVTGTDEDPEDTAPSQGEPRRRLVKPRMRLQALLSRDGEATPLQVRWGWVPHWSMGTRPALTHLPLEQVMRSRLYARLRDEGRALIPVEGWYEAARDDTPGARPRLAYVTSRRNEPLFLAAVAQASDEHNGCDGLALVTYDPGNGVTHLLAFDEAGAQAWLRAGLDWEQARTLANQGALGADHLEQLFWTKRTFMAGRRRSTAMQPCATSNAI
ncbi:hypothetical protein E2H86_02170 [Pseudomonas putida]|uniref:SOS response-associated peptidase family protein n=1 Tax=Pseudomonas putida TaxID=303 RepID=UPI00105A986E|nr:SOS response-associated peptidase family protein [Pseudomonas putida]TDJ79429.1 hypothetical protein E2H86_02170 [Pseudomonas putida]